MSISLFPHNQTACKSLLTAAETERRTSVIRLTDTGKRFSTTRSANLRCMLLCRLVPPNVRGVLLVLAAALLLIFFPLKANAEELLWPEAEAATDSGGDLQVDAHGASDGYFFASCATANTHRLKLRVIKDETTLTYDLNGDCDYELFPLQLGSGSYEITLYENVGGKKYAQKGTVRLSVTLEREDAAFFVPNQYVNYTRYSDAVAEGERLCSGMSEKQAFETLCAYMKNNFVYDFIKALNVTPGMLPDVDGTFEKKMGVCQDLSAVLASMLRTQHIPAKLVIGYADKQYHAWITATVTGKEEFFDPTAAVSGIGKVKDYSVERYY